MVHLTVCSCHVTYMFQSESTLYSCLNVKELLLEAGAKSEGEELSGSEFESSCSHFKDISLLSFLIQHIYRSWLYND